MRAFMVFNSEKMGANYNNPFRSPRQRFLFLIVHP